MHCDINTNGAFVFSILLVIPFLILSLLLYLFEVILRKKVDLQCVLADSYSIITGEKVCQFLKEKIQNITSSNFGSMETLISNLPNQQRKQRLK